MPAGCAVGAVERHYSSVGLDQEFGPGLVLECQLDGGVCPLTAGALAMTAWRKRPHSARRVRAWSRSKGRQRSGKGLGRKYGHVCRICAEQCTTQAADCKPGTVQQGKSRRRKYGHFWAEEHLSLTAHCKSCNVSVQARQPKHRCRKHGKCSQSWAGEKLSLSAHCMFGPVTLPARQLKHQCRKHGKCSQCWAGEKLSLSAHCKSGPVTLPARQAKLRCRIHGKCSQCWAGEKLSLSAHCKSGPITL